MTKKVLILLVITFSIVKISSSVDYCNIKTCNPQNSQTMCRYQVSIFYMYYFSSPTHHLEQLLVEKKTYIAIKNLQ